MIYRHRVAVFVCTITFLALNQLDLHIADFAHLVPSVQTVATAAKVVFRKETAMLLVEILRCILMLDFYGLVSILQSGFQVAYTWLFAVAEQSPFTEEVTNGSVCLALDAAGAQGAEEEQMRKSSRNTEPGEPWWVLSWIQYIDETVVPYISEKLENLSYLHIVTFLAIVVTPWIRPVKTLKDRHLITSY